MTDARDPNAPIPTTPFSGDPSPEVVFGIPDEAPPPETGGSLLLSVVGAVIGAAAGAFVWFLVEYYLEVQVGYVALLVGALAGGGAALLGRRRGIVVGVIAAAAGVAGIFGGSYAVYRVAIDSDEVRAEWRKPFDEMVTAIQVMDPAARPLAITQIDDVDLQKSFEAMYRDGRTPTAAELDTAFEQLCDAIKADESLSYTAFLTSDTKYMMFMLLFGLFGLGIGFKVGAKGIGG